MKNTLRALRLPFISASILPFIFGSLLSRPDFNFLLFLLGLIAVIATHLSANLINDYADSKSGADWQDMNFYKFFGGSKLIQKGIFPEKFYFRAALSFALIAVSYVIALAFILRSLFVIVIYLCIIFFSWSYSQKPLQFSYRRLGEIFIFLLFGPALVMGGYFIQTGIFPSREGFFLSLPFGLLTTAILFANEVPDYSDDVKSGKFTWVSIVKPEHAFLPYSLLTGLAFFFILLEIKLGYLKLPAAFSLFFIALTFKAAVILKKYPRDKERLVGSSKLTIITQTMVSLVLILALIL
ncbi:MAG TPA: prenyltransferase [Candidatus Margulisiibacteriota bacterium]|nr:prenyltransferase [Candidatus Margulisiibacteriota bacterium]